MRALTLISPETEHAGRALIRLTVDPAAEYTDPRPGYRRIEWIGSAPRSPRPRPDRSPTGGADRRTPARSRRPGFDYCQIEGRSDVNLRPPGLIFWALSFGGWGARVPAIGRDVGGEWRCAGCRRAVFSWSSEPAETRPRPRGSVPSIQGVDGSPRGSSMHPGSARNRGRRSCPWDVPSTPRSIACPIRRLRARVL